MTTPAMASSSRRYDKGDRRYKHVGHGSVATVAIDPRNPRKKVGKCPDDIPQPLRTSLLATAIPSPLDPPGLPFAGTLYLTFRGVIYECQASDDGRTYHAYPFDGRLPQSLVTALEASADAQAHPREFSSWRRLHVKVLG